MMDSWKKYTLGCKQKRQPQKENQSLLWIVAREKKLRKRDRGKAPEGRTNKDETGTTPIRSLTQESCKSSQRALEKSLPSKKELKNQIEEAVKSGKLAHLIKGIKKGKSKQAHNQLEEWVTPAVKTEPITEGNEEPILMIGVINNPLKRKEPPKS
ncbi:hypothetical protein Tco_1316016 [Tanacetum coccineum]